MCFNRSKSSSAQTRTTTVTDQRTAGSGKGNIVTGAEGRTDIRIDAESPEAIEGAFGFGEDALERSLDFGAKAFDFAGDLATTSAAQTQQFAGNVIRQIDEGAQEVVEGQVTRMATLAIIAVGAVMAIASLR
ncbi:MAG: hypothetical protein GWO16_08435 [Gammaproteobacteria bacterium]|nr:hypothetical protein [Gammaproteobacteria bacterium]NIR97975.1 hypothetical protein [Gammaproteobacteria bacterium]NIT63675.1 hypothetical protein [Gammaproteobacteria bacterium]NIV21533.1 hypothetical protein [Gammaproteobacteria bacterium]NIY32255.1 hypothetical protein [Gammaproteobacteria bacterium]